MNEWSLKYGINRYLAISYIFIPHLLVVTAYNLIIPYFIKKVNRNSEFKCKRFHTFKERELCPNKALFADQNSY